MIIESFNNIGKPNQKIKWHLASRLISAGYGDGKIEVVFEDQESKKHVIEGEKFSFLHIEGA